MNGFFTKRDRLEGALRAARPKAPEALVSSIEARVLEMRRVRAPRFGRVAVPLALTAAIVTAIASFGGVGYAASSVEQAAKQVASAFAPDRSGQAAGLEAVNAGHDQYRPGFGWGDPNHTHTGPPGLVKKGGAFAPPLVPRVSGPTAYVSTSFTLDEQAHLTLSVFDAATHKKLLLTQTKTKISKAIDGRQTKNIQYLVLVPRAIPLRVAIPANLIKPGHNYYVRIRARSPLNIVTFLRVPISV